MRKSLAATTLAVAALAVAVLTGAALAGTGNSNGTKAAAAAPVSVPAGKAQPQRKSGVLGAQATITRKTPRGVLGTTTRFESSRLPFTGLALWIFVIVAGALFAAGFTLRHAGRETL
jgi:hypothetical protein